MAEYIMRSEHDRQRLVSFLQSADLSKPLKVSITKLEVSRSAAQNRLLWKWNSAIQLHMRESFGQIASAEEWHEVLVNKLCPSTVRRIDMPDGTAYKVGRARTSDFKVKEMTEYLERLDHYCADGLGLLLPHPEDLVYAIWGERCAA